MTTTGRVCGFAVRSICLCALLLASAVDGSSLSWAAAPQADRTEALARSAPGGSGATGCIDQDGDLFGEGCESGPDCDDTRAKVNPAALELYRRSCFDGLDNDCNGSVDGADAKCCRDHDGDGFTWMRPKCKADGELPDGKQWGDCNDRNPAVNPGSQEFCGDRRDNDCDGYFEEECPDAAPLTCGDGKLDPGEACDGAQLSGESCASFALGSGELACLSNCHGFDAGGCSDYFACDGVDYSAAPFDLDPETPVRLDATAVHCGAIRVRWRPPSIISLIPTGYRVYRDDVLVGNATAKPPGDTQGRVRTFVDTGLSPDTEYTYRVAAYNELGAESDVSDSVTTRTPRMSTSCSVLLADTTPPRTPRGLRLTASECSLQRAHFEFELDQPSTDYPTGVSHYLLYLNGIPYDEFSLGDLSLYGLYVRQIFRRERLNVAVSAVDGAGNESALSETLQVPVPDCLPFAGAIPTAVVLINFPDVPAEPFLPEEAREVFFEGERSADAYWRENTYGQSSLDGQVYGWVTAPHPTDHYCDRFCSTTQIVKDVTAMLGLDIDTLQHPFFVIALPSVFVSTSNGSRVTLHPTVFDDMNLALGTVLHEAGHGWGGLGHSAVWHCPETATVGPDLTDIQKHCRSHEYGDPYSPMGYGLYSHYSAAEKYSMGVVPDLQQARSTREGVYPIDVLELPSSGFKEVRVPLGGLAWYSFEYRQPVGFDAMERPPMDGVLVRLLNLGLQGVNAPGALLRPLQLQDGGNLLVPGDLVLDETTSFTDPYRRVHARLLHKDARRAAVQICPP